MVGFFGARKKSSLGLAAKTDPLQGIATIAIDIWKVFPVMKVHIAVCPSFEDQLHGNRS